MIIKLRPTGQARLERMAIFEVRDLTVELLDEMWPLGPRSNEAHFSFQYVEELRQFVDPSSS